MDTGKITPNHLSNIVESMVEKNLAAYEPSKQVRSILVYWRLPEEWAEVLYQWVRMRFKKLLECNFSFVIFKVVNSGQLNTIMTFYDITDPPVESDLTNIPVPLLRKAIAILGKTGRSQMISITDGEGVRFLAK